MPGSLVCGANTTDNVSFGTNSALDNIDKGTIMQWCYGTIAQSAWNFRKGTNALGLFNFKFFNSATRAAFSRDRATVDQLANADLANFAYYGLNKWVKFAATWDLAGVNGDQKLYMGDIGHAPAEPSAYFSQTVGSGLSVTNAGSTAYMGNRDTIDAPFIGRLGPLALFSNVILTIPQLESWFKIPRKQVAGNNAALFVRPGKHGADAFEYAGIGNGTVTGCTQGDGAPANGWWAQQ